MFCWHKARAPLLFPSFHVKPERGDAQKKAQKGAAGLSRGAEAPARSEVGRGDLRIGSVDVGLMRYSWRCSPWLIR